MNDGGELSTLAAREKGREKIGETLEPQFIWTLE